MRETLALVRRTPGCMLLLLGNFCITVGSSIVLPYLAIYLVHEHGMSPWAVGMAFTVRLWAQFGLMVVGGAVSDRLGPMNTMCLGLVLRGASYVLLAGLSSSIAVIAACGLLGLGSALYIPAGKAALAGLVGDPSKTASVFALRSATNNAGLAIGPLVGGVLLLGNPSIGLAATSLVFFALALAFWRVRGRLASPRPASGMDAKTRGADGRRSSLREIPALLRHNPRMRWVVLTAMAFGFCYVQVEYALPVTVAEHQSAGFVGVLFTVNAVSVVALQFLVTGPMGNIANSALVISGGLIAMAAGFGLLGFGSMGALVAGVVLFSLGEVIVDPRLDGEVAGAVDAEHRGAAFGLVGMCIAIGGTGANAAASALTGADRLGDGYWLLMMGGAAALSLLVLAGAPRRRVRQPEHASSVTR
ncbi:MFS transporter [Streptomyces badius]